MNLKFLWRIWRLIWRGVKNPRRVAGAKRGWERRRQRELGLPLPMQNNPLLENNERPGTDANGTGK